MRPILKYVLLTFLLVMHAGAAIVVTYRGDEPNAFNFLPLPSDTDLDINGDGTVDFRFLSDGSFVAAMMGYGDNRFVSVLATFPNLGGYVVPVQEGSIIGLDTAGLSGDWYHHTDNANNPSLSSGFGLSPGAMQFADAYIGVEFETEAGIHYGWIQYVGFSHPEKGVGYPLLGGFINAWAWETEPGVPIEAGAIPEPGVLAMLLAGTLLASKPVRRRVGLGW